ncbi:MAG: LPS export ABC transporter permease LptF [Gammaproteobacteria bacterium]
MLRIIDRYLLKEVALNWMAVTLVLWLIVVSNRLARYLGEAAAGDLPGNIVFTLLGLKSIEYLVVLLPLTLYLGVLLALGRLYKDSEMAALGAGGIGPAQLYRPLLSLVLPVAVLIAVLALFVAPRAAALGNEVRARAEVITDLSAITAGRFQETSSGRMVFYAERVSPDRGQLEGLFVRTEQQGQATLLTAPRAYPMRDAISGDRFLVMEDGYRYQGIPGDAVFRILKFARHGVRLESPGAVEARFKHEALPSAALWGSVNPRDIAELQWRLSLPLAAVSLVLLAVPLSRTTPREGRFGRIFSAVLVFIVYYNLMGTAQVWVEKGTLAPLPGMWWVHALPLGLTLALFQAERLRAGWRRT